MEGWLGPATFGAAGFAFATWVLLSDSRRMGFARPGGRGRPAAQLTLGLGKWQTPILLAAAAVLGAAVTVTRKAVAVVILVTLARRTLISARRRARIADMRREWPFLIESMAVAALSGMETGASFQAAAKRTRGALRVEVDKVVLRMMGGSTLSRALGVVDEVSLPDAKRLRTVLAQSEILGTPVAGLLKTLSDEGYDAERQELEERFNALPLKLSVITVFFLLPPVLAVSIIPHVLAFLEARW